MPFVFKRLALFLSIAAAFAADKDRPFHVGPVEGYPGRQTQAGVTVAADPYGTEEKAQTAFGKLVPYKYGILPVLVVVKNESPKAIRLDRLKAEYVGRNRERVDATPARDVRYLNGPRRPAVTTGPTGAPRVGKHKNPLDAWEIEGRAFAAKMLPPGQTASGFFYFQTGLQRGATVYLTGLSEADTGTELFYFEVPLQ